MLRAPTWMTSTASLKSSASCAEVISLTTGSPVCSRASRRMSSPSMPSPWKANGEVRGLNAPPRSIEAPAAATARATPSVCSRDSTVHGPAIRQNVSGAPTRCSFTWTTVGSWCESSLDASLYGREIGITRSTPGSPSSPISRTPSGSPIAPMAVVSSPGMTFACTPPAWRRSTTASIWAGVASGVITTITRRPPRAPFGTGAWSRLAPRRRCRSCRRGSRRPGRRLRGRNPRRERSRGHARLPVLHGHDHELAPHVPVRLGDRPLPLNAQRTHQGAHVLGAERVRLGGRRLAVHVDVEDERAVGPEDPHDLREHRGRIGHVVERVAGDDDVHGLAEQRDRLGAGGQVHRIAAEQEPGGVEARGERLDGERQLRAAGLGQPDRTGADLEHDAVLEEVRVVDLGLAQHAPHLRARLLPAASLVAVRDLGLADQLKSVRREQRARADVRLPALDPEAKLLLGVAALALAAAQEAGPHPRQRTMPAPTVSFVDSSMRMKLPVARLRRYWSTRRGVESRRRSLPISFSSSSSACSSR